MDTWPASGRGRNPLRPKHDPHDPGAESSSQTADLFAPDHNEHEGQRVPGAGSVQALRVGVDGEEVRPEEGVGEVLLEVLLQPVEEKRGSIDWYARKQIEYYEAGRLSAMAFCKKHGIRWPEVPPKSFDLPKD